MFRYQRFRSLLTLSPVIEYNPSKPSNSRFAASAIAAGPKVRGGVGSRNEMTSLARRKLAAGGKAKPKVKGKGRAAKSRGKQSKRRS